MPPIKGRLGDRKNATIELEDRKIHIASPGGFFAGKPENRVISLDEVISIEHETDVKPFPDAMMIKLVTHEGEISFFSINIEPLEKLAVEAEEYIERHARLLLDMEREFKQDREAHVAQLFLNMELADSLLELIVGLHGSVDWDMVETQFKQVKRVNQDRDNLTQMRPAHISLETLELGVVEREVEAIKTETYDILFLLNESCLEKGRHPEPWFNTHLYSLFIDALMNIWSRRLEGLTGESIGEGSEKANRRLQELIRLLPQKDEGEEAREIDPDDFNGARIRLFVKIEELGEVGFDPGEELEKRLASAAPVDHVSP